MVQNKMELAADQRQSSVHHKPKWTIMIYLAGDNNLTANCIAVLQQLGAVASRDDVRVLVCFDSNTPAPQGSRYLEIGRKSNNDFNWGLYNDLVPLAKRGLDIEGPSFCDDNPRKSGDPLRSRAAVAEGVRLFVNWAMEEHEASERYMLLFYGHGPMVASQSFLAKENPQSFLKLTDLKRVLGKHFGPKKNRKLSILACDNCVMNGIETAVEVKDLADLMIGSQGLMLAVGWPYEKIISAVAEDPDASTSEIARKMLAVCARNLLDFTLMDRSSEQSVCDLTMLSAPDNVVRMIKDLVKALRRGLAFGEENGTPSLVYPAICDAVKLARLDAQSYWSETFVDISDFCERLLKKCNDVALMNTKILQDLGYDEDCPPKEFRNTALIKTLRDIVQCCEAVRAAVTRMVPPSHSYYIGSALQYSHGLSIYFPWTRPEGPYFFEMMPKGRDYTLRTPFETYGDYEFSRKSGWSEFLTDFFKATLRRVRRAPQTFDVRGDSDSLDSGLIDPVTTPDEHLVSIDLEKSSSDKGEPETGVTIKNYPRRNYLSPSDCARKVDKAGVLKRGTPGAFEDPKQPPVSHLGWNPTGLVAEVIQPSNATQSRGKAKPATASQTSRRKAPRRP